MGSGYKPWSGTPNPNVPAGDPNRNTNGLYYGYDAWWPYYSPDPRGSTPAHYVVASLEGADGYTPDDYVIRDQSGNWVLNDGRSPFLQRLDCTSGAGNTSYSLSIEEAQYELSRNGRGNVQDVIIFMSDGAANMFADEPAGRALVEQPDQSRPTSAGPAFIGGQRQGRRDRHLHDRL